MYVPGLTRRPFFAPTPEGNGGSSQNADTPAETPEDVETPNSAEQTPEPQAAANAERERNREGYEQRQAKKKLDDLQKELDGYKRRDEEARKAKQTQEERTKEELETTKAENERLKAEKLRDKVAAEFKLPPALANRLIGSDEDALRADAEELAKLLPPKKAGNPADPVRENAGKPTYTREQLRKDPKLALKVAEDYRLGKCTIVN